VMAPAQLVDVKDLPPELQLAPVAVRAPTAPSLPPAAVADAGGRAGEAPIPATATSLAGAADHGGNAFAGTAAAALGQATEVGWLAGLEQEARQLLRAGEPMVWDTLTRRFEGQLIHTALEITRGRRIEAAQKLGIGRNTITRKIQELGLEEK